MAADAGLVPRGGIWEIEHGDMGEKGGDGGLPRLMNESTF
jgi:hypothetical protein